MFRHRNLALPLCLVVPLAFLLAGAAYAAAEEVEPATLLVAEDDFALPSSLQPTLEDPLPISPPPREPDETPAADPFLESTLQTTPASVPKSVATAEEQSPRQGFSNACKPAPRRVAVPKNLRELKHQLGEGFQACRRGPFLVASDVHGDEFSEIVDGYLACCRECLGREFFASEPRDTITIYVFRDETSYAANLRLLFHMDPISPYGHYGHSQRYIVVNYSTGPGTLVHELTHALMATDFPAAPIWLAEGMASLFEQCRVEGDFLRGESNWRLPELKAALAKAAITPLARLLKLSPSEFRGRHESLHYAESRYFCKYLQDRGVLAAVYRSFRRDSERDPSGAIFVEQALQLELAAIERNWHEWLQGQDWQPTSHH